MYVCMYVCKLKTKYVCIIYQGEAGTASAKDEEDSFGKFILFNKFYENVCMYACMYV